MCSKYEIVLRAIFTKGLESVLPQNVFSKHVKLIKDNKFLQLSSDCGKSIEINLSKNKEYREEEEYKCHVIGFGKAVYGLAAEFESFLRQADKNLHSGVISVPAKTQATFGKAFQPNSVIKILEGAKDNLPDVAAIKAAEEIKLYAESMTEDDILFVLISGGGSALLPLPISGLTLDGKLEIIKQLARQGATIDELNYVRIVLSNIKGGKLAMAAKNAHQVISLIISDIIGDPIDLIASGPTIRAKDDTNLKAKAVLEKYSLWENLGDSIKSAILNEKTKHFPTNGFAAIIANNKIAIKAALKEAEKQKFSTVFLSDSVSGNVSDVSQHYFEVAKFIRSFIDGKSDENVNSIESHLKWLNVDYKRFKNDLEKLKNQSDHEGICLVAGGETTVNIRGSGLGGRNQQMVLEFMAKCQKENIRNVFLLSGGTDGIDGPTNAAGAIGSLNILESQFPEKRNHIDDFINNNDSYNFLTSKPCHLITGHTGTNVMDLQILLIPNGK